MSAQPTKLTIEELRAQRQAEREAEDHQREEEDRLSTPEDVFALYGEGSKDAKHGTISLLT
jgi:hypothetical protein